MNGDAFSDALESLALYHSRTQSPVNPHFWKKTLQNHVTDYSMPDGWGMDIGRPRLFASPTQWTFPDHLCYAASVTSPFCGNQHRPQPQ
jgi:hypothetical protein